MPADETPRVPQTLAVLPLRGMIVYPLTTVPLNVGQPRSIRLVDDVARQDNLVGLFTSRSPEQAAPGPSEIYHTGTLAVVRRMLRMADGTVRLLIEGVSRIRITSFESAEPYLRADVAPAPEGLGETLLIDATARHAAEMFQRLAEHIPSIPGDLIAASLNPDDPVRLAYTIANYLRLELKQAQQLLEIDNVLAKLDWLIGYMGKELKVVELGRKIQSEAHGQMERAQREFYLREQLKAIQRELGESDDRLLELEVFRAKINDAGMPEEARQEANRELSRLGKIPAASAEYGVVRTYLEWLTSLPWDDSTQDNLDLRHARAVLDEDHHDLVEIKDRIIEYLAVRKLRQERGLDETRDPLSVIRDPSSDHVSRITSHESRITGNGHRERSGAILCFVGPPGVGKTSLGRSIARALDRKFTRISLGGMRDEAEIRGHRRTYIGALPGRIIEAIRRVGSNNPVIMLDEVDKIGVDFRGDPASALLEVLDPEQNREFRDHYLDVPFDLSRVMFIATANTLDPISPPLRDRMEILPLSGYTETEKMAIAEGYLIPRQVAENGLHPSELCFSGEAIRAMIRSYTREAGVRGLERQIGRVCRKVATGVATNGLGNGPVKSVTVAADMLDDYLGAPRFVSETAERTQIPGVATGLYWTSSGGDIIFIEAAKMPGGKRLVLTGQLGEVIKESAEAALSYIRSQASSLGIDPAFYECNDLHIHVPAGAIHKDGPSAGVTIVTALASLLSGRPVRSDIGMTGEITLRGQLLPIGGLKEKVLAAHRAGLRVVILPQRNARDLEQIPDEIRQEMTFVLADTVQDVLEAALTDGTNHLH